MLTPGSRLDRYVVIDELGAGAFGVVLRARHLDLGREDAIKVPHDPDLARQFVTEGRLVAQLDHPNIVRVYAMNVTHDPPYIVYELVEGQSLRRRMAEVGGPMDCDEVVQITRQVLAGLIVAHDLGIVHRDIKPENILLRRDGVAKIADFGLGVAVQQMSMLVSRSVSRGSAALASQLGVSREVGSAVGSSVAGTLAYMSPEQEDGLELDGRADLFALGVLMYEAVTGARPRGRFGDPADLNPAVRGCLNDTIINALATAPKDRPPDAQSMLQQLTMAPRPPCEPSSGRPTAVRPARGIHQFATIARRFFLRDPNVAPAIAAPAPEHVGRREIVAETARGDYSREIVVSEAAAAELASSTASNAWDRPGTHTGEEIVGPDGGTYLWVPSGGFQMGRADGPQDQRPVHEVALDGFWLAKVPVTNRQFAAFLRRAGSTCPPEWVDLLAPFSGIFVAAGGRVQPKPECDSLPVVEVSWHGAQAYCEHYGLCLPTEAQWEYAARGPQNREYPWGRKYSHKLHWHHHRELVHGWVIPVGHLPRGASWCGALDMVGNVWEWCDDQYEPDYYATSPRRNPVADAPDGLGRVLRGGCAFISGKPDCRPTFRLYMDPGATLEKHGFRTAIRVEGLGA